MRIHQVISDKRTLKGLLLYVVHSDKERSKQLVKNGKDLALGAVLYFDRLEAEIVTYKNLETIQQKNISEWHHDFKGVIDQLKITYSSQRVNYMVSMIENFIKATIKSRFDYARVLR